MLMMMLRMRGVARAVVRARRTGASAVLRVGSRARLNSALVVRPSFVRPMTAAAFTRSFSTHDRKTDSDASGESEEDLKAAFSRGKAGMEQWSEHTTLSADELRRQGEDRRRREEQYRRQQEHGSSWFSYIVGGLIVTVTVPTLVFWLFYLTRHRETLAWAQQSLDLLGHEFIRRGMFAPARFCLERIVNVDVRRFGPGSVRTNRSALKLATLLILTGDFDTASKLLDHMLQHRTVDPSPESMEVAVPTLQLLGNVYRKTGERAKQRQVLEEAAQLQRTLHGADDEVYGLILLELAEVYYALEEHELALKAAKFSLHAILRAAHEFRNDSAAQRANPERAFELSLQQAVLHTVVAGAHGRLGRGDLQRKSMDAAFALLADMYPGQFTEQQLGHSEKEKHQPTLLGELIPIAGVPDLEPTMRLKLIPVLLAQANAAHVEDNVKQELLERVIQIQESVYQSDHVEMLDPLHHLGDLLGTHQPALAVPYLSRAQALAQKHMGDDHSLTIDLAQKLREFSNKN